MSIVWIEMVEVETVISKLNDISVKDKNQTRNSEGSKSRERHSQPVHPHFLHKWGLIRSRPRSSLYVQYIPERLTQFIYNIYLYKLYFYLYFII